MTNPTPGRTRGNVAVRSCAWTVSFALAASVLISCADATPPDPVEASDYVVTDSGGVQIVTSPPELLEDTLPWSVDSLPTLELGQVDGDGPSTFSQIGGVTIVPDGHLVVVDRQSSELRWFDERGRHRFSIGGRGQGPGEYFDPRLLPQVAGDSLLVFDTRLNARRITWVALDGSGVRVKGPQAGPPELLAGSPTVAMGSRVLFRSARLQCERGEPCRVPLALRLVDFDSAESQTLAELELRFLIYEAPGQAPALTENPFNPIGIAAAGPQGLIVGSGPPFEVRTFDESGRLAKISRVDTPPRPVDQAALDRARSALVDLGVSPRSAEDIHSAMDMPESLPAFQSLRVDALGWLWAEIFRVSPDEDHTWLLFDPEGRARGVIELPTDLEVHEIGEDYVVGVWQDDLGVEYVRRYDLDRSP